MQLPGGEVEIPTSGFGQPRHINHLAFPLMGFSHPQKVWFPSDWQFLKNPFGQRKSISAAELHHPTLLHPSHHPAQIFPLNYESSCHWPSVFKLGKVICHFSLGPTTSNKNNKTPRGKCWKGLSFPSNERVFLPSLHSLLGHEKTTLAPSSGRGQILELRQQRSAKKSPPPKNWLA